MNMKKVLIALGYGQSIRDVLRSETYEFLKKNKELEIVLLSKASENSEFRDEFGGENIHFEVLNDYIPSKLENLFQSFYLSTLADKSNTIKLYAKNDKKSSLRIFAPISKVLSKLIGRFRLQKVLGYLMRISNPERKFKELFDKHNFDVVIVTRVLRASPDYPVLKEAAIRKTPVVALVSSWDNFTTKGFFPFGVTRLVVWNELMQQEAIDLFGFPKESIYISGIPRFDNYFKRVFKRTKEGFFRDHNLDLDKKLVTYTTGSKALVLPPGHKTSAEADVVKVLAQEINEGKLENCQLLVRLHPLADVDDFSFLNSYTNVTLQIPGKQGLFKDRLFSRDDDIEIAETVYYSDLTINVASTMTIDSAVFDTPSLCVAFDARGKLPIEQSVLRIYEYEHYRKLRSTGGVHMVYSFDELIEESRKYLLDPQKNQNGRKAIIDQQCQYTDGKSAIRVGKFIHEYLDSI